MAQLHIESNKTFSIDVTTRESDKYTESVYLKFELNYAPEKIFGTHEMFLTPDQLEDLGKFLVQESKQIRETQVARALTERIRKNPNMG